MSALVLVRQHCCQSFYQAYTANSTGTRYVILRVNRHRWMALYLLHLMYHYYLMLWKQSSFIFCIKNNKKKNCMMPLDSSQDITPQKSIWNTITANFKSRECENAFIASPSLRLRTVFWCMNVHPSVGNMKCTEPLGLYYLVTIFKKMRHSGMWLPRMQIKPQQWHVILSGLTAWEWWQRYKTILPIIITVISLLLYLLLLMKHLKDTVYRLEMEFWENKYKSHFFYSNFGIK